MSKRVETNAVNAIGAVMLLAGIASLFLIPLNPWFLLGIIGIDSGLSAIGYKAVA